MYIAQSRWKRIFMTRIYTTLLAPIFDLVHDPNLYALGCKIIFGLEVISR